MRAVIFDLDGTLIDSEPDLRAAMNRALARHGQAPLASVKPMIGDGVAKLVERGFAARGLIASPADHAAFVEDYEANAAHETGPFPGILEMLRRLSAAGYALGICTNKPVQATHNVLSALGLDGFFDAVAGGDSTPHRKPDPRHLEAALAALGTRDAVMIGDHENDIKAAQGCQVPSIFVEWGYGQAQGDFSAASPADLPGLIDSIAKAKKVDAAVGLAHLAKED